MGDINHSYKFSQKYLESVAEVIKDKVKRYLRTPLPQTGFSPPVKVLADKATHKHRTRQFVGLTTIVPNAVELIQYVSGSTHCGSAHWRGCWPKYYFRAERF